MKQRYLEAGADISEDGIHRYWLSRRLSMGERMMAMIGLNPSTADAHQDDPTIRRGVGYARLWGFDWFYMGNLNAYRSTDPKKLPGEALLAVGPRNQEALTWICQKAELVICGWGQNKLNDYAAELGRRIIALPHARYLKLNADGSPAHPLYLAKSLQPQPFASSRGGA